MKIAFLDRDGTINRDYPDEDWKNVSRPELLKGSVEGMRYILSKGYKIIIISNQYIIGEGIISLEQCTKFNQELVNILESKGVNILDIFFCPHSRNEECYCRKPKTGLIKQAVEKYPTINLSKSFMCGDSIADLQCSNSSGLKFYGINIGEIRLQNLNDLKEYI